MRSKVLVLGGAFALLTLACQPAHGADRKNRLRAVKTNQHAIEKVTTGKVKEAGEGFLEAARQDPTFADPIYNLANLAIAQRDWDQALRWFRVYERVEKNHHRLILALAKEAAVIVEGEKQAAKAAMTAKDYRGATVRLQGCVQLEPANNNLRLSLGMAQAAAGDYAAARTTLTKLVKPTSGDQARAAKLQLTLKNLQALDHQQEVVARKAFLQGKGAVPMAAKGRHGKGGDKSVHLYGSWNGVWKLDAADRNEVLNYNYAVNEDGNNFLEVTVQIIRKPDEDWDSKLPPLSKNEAKHLSTITATTRFPLKVTAVAADRLNVDCGPGQLVTWVPGSVSQHDMEAWLDINTRMNVAVPHFQSLTLEANGSVH